MYTVLLLVLNVIVPGDQVWVSWYSPLVSAICNDSPIEILQNLRSVLSASDVKYVDCWEQVLIRHTVSAEWIDETELAAQNMAQRLPASSGGARALLGSFVLALRKIPPVCPEIERTCFVPRCPEERCQKMCEYFCNNVRQCSLGQLVTRLRWATDEYGSYDKRTVELSKLSSMQVDLPDKKVELPRYHSSLRPPHWDMKKGKSLKHRHSDKVLGVISTRVEAKIKEVEEMLIPAEALLIDTALVTGTHAQFLKEATALMSEYRKQYALEMANKGLAQKLNGNNTFPTSIGCQERDHFNAQHQIKGGPYTQDQMLSIASAAALSTYKTLESQRNAPKLKDVDKLIGCCWHPMLAWLCRLKSDYLSAAGIAKNYAHKFAYE